MHIAHYGGPASLQFSEPCGKIPSLSAANVCENIFTMHALYLFLSLSLSRWARGEMSCCICPPEIHSTVICFGSLSSLLQL